MSESQETECEWKWWGLLVGLAHNNFHLQTSYSKVREEGKAASGNDPWPPNHPAEQSPLPPLLIHFGQLAWDMSEMWELICHSSLALLTLTNTPPSLLVMDQRLLPFAKSLPPPQAELIAFCTRLPEHLLCIFTIYCYLIHQLVCEFPEGRYCFTLWESIT